MAYTLFQGNSRLEWKTYWNGIQGTYTRRVRCRLDCSTCQGRNVWSNLWCNQVNDNVMKNRKKPFSEKYGSKSSPFFLTNLLLYTGKLPKVQWKVISGIRKTKLYPPISWVTPIHPYLMQRQESSCHQPLLNWFLGM